VGLQWMHMDTAKQRKRAKMKNKEPIDADILREACEACGVEVYEDEDGPAGIIIPKMSSREDIENMFYNLEKYIEDRKKIH